MMKTSLISIAAAFSVLFSMLASRPAQEKLWGQTAKEISPTAEEIIPVAEAPPLKWMGLITNIEDGALTLQTVEAGEVTLIYDETTAVQIFSSRSGIFQSTDPFDFEASDATVAELLAGRWAVVLGTADDAGYHARIISLLPETFNASNTLFVIGVLTHLDHENQSFTILTANSEELVVTVNPDVRLYNSLPALNELEIGMTVSLAAVRLDDGTLIALALAPMGMLEAQPALAPSSQSDPAIAPSTESDPANDESRDE